MKIWHVNLYLFCGLVASCNGQDFRNRVLKSKSADAPMEKANPQDTDTRAPGLVPGPDEAKKDPLPLSYTLKIENPQKLSEKIYTKSQLKMNCDASGVQTLEISKTIAIPGTQNCEMTGFGFGEESDFKPFGDGRPTALGYLFSNKIGLIKATVSRLAPVGNEVVFQVTIAADEMSSLVDTNLSKAQIALAASIEVNAIEIGTKADLLPGQTFRLVLTGSNRREVTRSKPFALYLDLVTSPPRSVTWTKLVSSARVLPSPLVFPNSGTLFNTGGFMTSDDGVWKQILTGTVSDSAKPGSTIYLDLMRSHYLMSQLPNLVYDSNMPQFVWTQSALRIKVLNAK